MECEAGCDAGTLITAPDCYKRTVQCIERCDACNVFPTDDAAAASLTARVLHYREECPTKDGCYHFVVAAPRSMRKIDQMAAAIARGEKPDLDEIEQELLLAVTTLWDAPSMEAKVIARAEVRGWAMILRKMSHAQGYAEAMATAKQMIALAKR